jgi:phosphatidylserine/phosphatidylglycerophosphate/cardiolipin synthase-like enzyme/uncharacterized membrane protein YdjX (TVP38/TMEM64 family)
MNSTILQPGRNAWRIERANRAAILIDGAAFFGAVRSAFLKARRSIFIVGWDIDSRTRLVGECVDPDDGYSPFLSEFIGELVETRPDLHVYILLWDYSIVYAGERELLPRLQWPAAERVTLCLDNALPFGASQHQKLIVVDDSLAFSGGLDLTLRRWDTGDHKPDCEERVDASEQKYRPFHDVQMMVDGETARALAVLARRRWCDAHRTEPPLDPVGDPWPEHVRPDFLDADVGISRTQPPCNGETEIREVQALFLDSIDRAKRSIYIENQFVTCIPVAQRLARRLRECATLEVLAVVPRRYESWVVSNTLGDDRIGFHRILERAGGDRVRVAYPSVSDGQTVTDTMVHSKIMIVDDRLLRVGSANLNNRSMGVDTECDLTIEAKNDRERAAIADIRNRLIGDHCGVPAAVVATEMERERSLIAVADRVSGNGHRLVPIEAEKRNGSGFARMAKSLLDPSRPLTAARAWRSMKGSLPAAQPARALMLVAIVFLILTATWYFTSLSEMIARERVQDLLAATRGSVLAPLLVLAAFLVGGAIAFPVTVLIVATAATFGPWLGFFYAAMGVFASALAMYCVGAWLGRDVMRPLIGRRWKRIRDEIEARGILAVATIRVVPIAPFTLVNLIAGACSIRLLDYLAGTLIGMLPGLVAISALGHQITTLVTDFSPANAALLLAIVAGWAALAWSAQSIAGRWRRRSQ